MSKKKEVNRIMNIVRHRKDWKALARFDKKMCDQSCEGWVGLVEPVEMQKAYSVAVELIDQSNWSRDFLPDSRVLALWGAYNDMYRGL